MLLTTALFTVSAAERYTGRLVSRVDLVTEGGELPPAADHLIEVVAGDPFQPDAVRRSIKQLFALGTFSDIKVEAEPVGNDVALTFRLFPALMVEDIQIQWAPHEAFPTDKFSKELLENDYVKREVVFDVDHLDRLSNLIQLKLVAEGFYQAHVEPEVRFQDSKASIRIHVRRGPQARLGKIRIEGVAPHAERAILSGISMNTGDRYSRRALNEEIERFVEQWKDRGFYEAKVGIEESHNGTDVVELSLAVDMGPRVFVEVEGTDFSKRVQNRLIPILRERSVSSDLIEESRANLEEYFRGDGYRDAAVTAERRTTGEGRYLLVNFQVELGQQYEIGEIGFTGLSTTRPSDLLSLLESKPGQAFQPLVWEEDIKQVKTFLRHEGLHRVSVIGNVKDTHGSSNALILEMHIEEGPRATVESIKVEGVGQLTTEAVVAASGLEVGGAFYPPDVLEARDKILNLYRNYGFREADVEFQASLDEAATRADVVFVVQEGEPTYVGRVILSGLDVTREKSLERDIVISPQAPLSAEALVETRQRLIGTGLFSNVDVEVLEENPATRTSDVLIRFEEGPRTSLGYGFGYNENDLARVEGEITRRNLFGLNRTVSFFGRASIRGSRFVATYRQPELFGYNLPTFFSAIYEEQDRTSFDFRQRGVGFQVSKRLSREQTMFFRYNLNKTDVFNVEIPPEELPREFRNIDLSTISTSLVTDSRDDPIMPSRGQLRLLNLEVSAHVIGSKSPYIKGFAQQFLYFSLPKKMVGVVGLRLGIGQTYREDRDALLPITERFFAGGANTLRGFGLDQASPKAPNGTPVGGNVLALLNLELRFPIKGKLGGVVFSDNGTVYRRIQIIRLLNWRYNLGFGFRYDTPLGPLRVDWGFKIDLRPGEPRSRVHVSLGHAF
jgi:outer membrane protein assembly complex protein YaeT